MAPHVNVTDNFYQMHDPAPGTAVEPGHLDIERHYVTSTTNPDPLPKLFQPLKIRNTTIKNRLWLSPMCMYSAEDGYTTGFHYMHYGQYAARGVGLMMVEATAVNPESRITPNCLGLWEDGQIAGLKSIVDHAHTYGAMAGIQLASSGRKGSTIALQLYGTRPTFKAEPEEGGWPDKVYSASDIAHSSFYYKPRALTISQIHQVQQDFVDAALRADKAGFDVIEIHAAHGYLLHQFYSPLSNNRTDEYGGSFENRVRMVIEVVQKVRKALPADKLLFVRVSGTDWVEGGWTSDDNVKLAKLLRNEGVDLLDVSSAEAVKKNVPGLLVSSVGLFSRGKPANDVLEAGSADAIFGGREFLRNTSFALSAAFELGINVKWPNQYSWGKFKKRYTPLEL
ncbi:NADH-dependent flavin oxidoreductase [Linderina macrospora]|uniref:NADH-dependent flavin oxidoreductase n=1 Tax=Linderina macrospora TaxID=4868 RepID=A0ACC1JCQ1_9FUNG|nr:NADH-dependent flavin oxidoreductase [Linderina macrospora]